MHPSRILFAAAVIGLASLATSQPKPGQSIATGSGLAAGIWIIDHQANTATKLQTTITGMNSILMLAPSLGFVGTVSNPADIFRITVSGTTVTSKKLNTTPTAGGNLSQIVFVGGQLFFVTQTGRSGAGTIQSVSIGGGPVTTVLDITSVGATQLANAVTTIGTTVYVATFNSGTSSNTGEIVAYDTVTKKGSLLMKLPKAKAQINATLFYNTGIVNMQQQPKGMLTLEGVYGDLLVVDPVAKKVVRHDFTGPRLTAVRTGTNLVNAFAYDPISQDWIVGSRDAHMERWVSGHSAEKILKVGASGSINGIHHFPAPKGLDVTTGFGCAGTGGFTPTDVSFGVPTAGNSGFKFGLHSGTGGDNVALLIGVRPQNPPLDLSPFGITPPFSGMPKCFLRTTVLIQLPVVLSGLGRGTGKATIAAPIPAAALGARIWRQWAELQKTKTNTLGVVVSNGRMTTVQ